MMNKRLNELAKIKGKIFAIFSSFSFLLGIVAITQAWLIATIVNEVFLQDKGLDDVWHLLMLLMLIFLLRGILSWVQTTYGIKLASFVKRKIRKLLLDKLSSSQASELYQQKTGKQVSVLTDAVDQLDAYFSSFLPQLIQAGIIPIMILVVVFTENFYSGLIMLVTAPLIPVFMIIIGSMTEKKAREQMGSMQRFSGHFLDILQGLTVLKIFGQSKNQRSEIIKMSNHFRDTTMSVLKVAFLSALMLEILATIATAMIAVEVGLRLVYGHLTFHTAFFVLLLAPELYLPLKNLGSSFHSGKTSLAAAETIWEVVDKIDETPTWGHTSMETRSPLSSLKIDEVFFSYDKKEILKNIQLQFKQNERVAIVGQSGSGKTTLLKLILGAIEPLEGKVFVNEKELSEYEEDDWLQQIAYLSQEPYLFSGTIVENILLSNPQASKEEVEQAAKEAGVDLFANSFHQGLQTVIGEGGQQLSGGEKQRVALARIFLKNASLVLLDEPTAGLDPVTEQLLIEAIARLSKHAIVITVAHRLETIYAADKIVVFSEGEVVGIGSHEELMEENEYYQKLVSVYRGELS